MSAIRHVTNADFVSEVVESSVPVLVDFYADWCGPCRLIAPVLEAVAREFDGRVKVVKVNIDDQPQLASYFRVESIPTLLAFREGRLVDTLVGVGSPAHLRQAVAKLAGSETRPAVRAG